LTTVNRHTLAGVEDSFQDGDARASFVMPLLGGVTGVEVAEGN